MLRNALPRSSEINKSPRVKLAKLMERTQIETSFRVSKNPGMLRFSKVSLRISMAVDKNHHIQQIIKVQGQCYWLSRISWMSTIVTHSFLLIIIMWVVLLSLQLNQLASTDFVPHQEWETSQIRAALANSLTLSHQLANSSKIVTRSLLQVQTTRELKKPVPIKWAGRIRDPWVNRRVRRNL